MLNPEHAQLALYRPLSISAPRKEEDSREEDEVDEERIEEEEEKDRSETGSLQERTPKADAMDLD